ncbi:MAG: hypothetical protein J6C43_01370 [Oscillospiraceae bacterium]|nr:hypothetical protein [Oscillospiraceae bacterium]MBP3520308.1 hypothetical protein [Oscillospiraceae bacterium]
MGWKKFHFYLYDTVFLSKMQEEGRTKREKRKKFQKWEQWNINGSRDFVRRVAQKMGLIFGRSSKNEKLFKKPLKRFSKSAILTSARAKRSAPPSPKPLTKNKSRSEE